MINDFAAKTGANRIVQLAQESPPRKKTGAHASEATKCATKVQEATILVQQWEGTEGAEPLGSASGQL